jgi:hypothetical protein
MAGLLTRPLSETFPAMTNKWPVVMVLFQKVHGASQQRDCPGFAPDSLLIRTQGLAHRTDSCAKVRLFSITA